MACQALLLASYLLGTLATATGQACASSAYCPATYICVDNTCVAPIRPVNARPGVLPSGYYRGRVHEHGTDGGYSRPFYGTPQRGRLYPYSPGPNQPGYHSAEMDTKAYEEATGYSYGNRNGYGNGYGNRNGYGNGYGTGNGYGNGYAYGYG